MSIASKIAKMFNIAKEQPSGTVTINGVKHHGSGDINIAGGKITVNGLDVTPSNVKDITVVIGDSVEVRRLEANTVYVAGAVYADHLDANTITAYGNIKSEKIDANTITAKEGNVEATTIDANTIKGQQVRQKASW